MSQAGNGTGSAFALILHTCKGPNPQCNSTNTLWHEGRGEGVSVCTCTHFHVQSLPSGRNYKTELSWDLKFLFRQSEVGQHGLQPEFSPPHKKRKEWLSISLSLIVSDLQGTQHSSCRIIHSGSEVMALSTTLEEPVDSSSWQSLNVN